MLVSCIMPTRGRQQYAQEALDCFLRQTHQDRELVIVDDADDPSFSADTFLDPSFDDGGLLVDGLWRGRIRYHRVYKRLTIGAKRNLACSRASGEVIIHWDSDDISAPERIEDQVTRLIDNNVGLTGYNAMKFYDVATGEWWKFTGGKHQSLGTSMCYTREFWRSLPFPDLNVGEDSAVVNRASRVVNVDAGNMMYARNHGGNTDKREAMLTADEWVKIA